MTKKLFLLVLGLTIAKMAFPQAIALRADMSAPAKTEQKSVYYLKPEGTLFEATPTTGNMTGTTYLYVPGWSITKFVPIAPGGNFYWHQDVYDMNGTCTSFDRTGKTEGNYATDEDGNFYLKSVFNGADALPTIVCAADSFTLSEENPHWGPLDYEIPAVMYWYPRLKSGTLTETENPIRPLQFTDDKVGNYLLGGMDNGYLFGSGTVSGGMYTSRGVQQVLEKPVAPLWVENVFLPAISKSGTPIPDGTELTMLLTNVETNSQGLKVPGSEILAELRCGVSDIVENDPIRDSNGTIYKKFAAMFHPTDGGLLIDREFAVVVRGFDQAGVDIGLSGSDIPYYNNVLNPALCLLETADGKKSAANIYANNRIALGVTFSAKFDYANGFVDVNSTKSYNYGLVQMNDAGTEGRTTCPTNLVFEGAVAQVNGNWYDAGGTEQYTLSGMADWIKGYEVDDETYKNAGLTVISFTCEALPQDTKGRKCDILIHGKGVVSDKPLTVVQGEIPTAIGDVTITGTGEDSPMYNVAGQRVKKGYKGIVIQNGVKRMGK